MSWVLTVLGFVALILLHEFGHFIAAKAVGMRVERFSLFFGRPLVSVRRGETDYTIGPIPLGGYVKISGMNPRELEQESEGEDPQATAVLRARAYCNQPVWKRIVVIAAGPAMNLLLAFALLAGIYHFYGYDQTLPTTIVDNVIKGTPAASAGLRTNDEIVAVDGQRGSYARLSALIASHRCPGVQVQGCRAATPVTLTILRGKQLNQRLTVVVYPRYDTKNKPAKPRIGVSFYGEITPVPASLGGAASDSLGEMWSVTSLTVSKFAQIFTSSKARSQIHTVAGISDELSQAFNYSAAAALGLLALVSLSLAVINLFPFLPLDGGHIFWALAEKVRRRPIPVSVMEKASAAGIALVLFIFLIGFSNDINTFANGGFHLR